MWLKRLVHLFAAGTAVNCPMAPKAPGVKDKGTQDTNSSADAKIHCDEAAGYLKTGNYTKALNGYNLVSTHSSDDMILHFKAGNCTKGLINFNLVSIRNGSHVTAKPQDGLRQDTLWLQYGEKSQQL
jgi:hypothetical protein